MPTEHALLSPSSASRWIACPPSARLESEFPSNESAASAEGTLAHKLGETLIRRAILEIGAEEFDALMQEIKANPLYSTAMQEYMEDYRDYVLEEFEASKTRNNGYAVLVVEQRLTLTDYIPEGFGTGDIIIIGDDRLDIIDLKYGQGVRVSCEGNKQMMAYALGAIREFSLMYDVRNIRMTIYQPRMQNISYADISVIDLLVWGNDILSPAATLAYSGKGELCPGDHCKFCRAKVRCKALAEYTKAVIAKDFEEPIEDLGKADLLTDEELTCVLAAAETITSWLNSVKEYALKQAIAGKNWPGYKLVEGRSNRVWSNETAVIETLRSNNIPDEKIFNSKLKGLGDIEKATGKSNFVQWLDAYIIKPQGAPALVPESDKRPVFNPKSTAEEDFGDTNLE